MASILSARQALRLPRQLRLFSTSLSVGSGSTDVKRLGVVGAGQMVSPPLSLNPRLYVADHGLSWSTGLGDCPRGRPKGPGARYARRLGAKLPGQGHWLCRLVAPPEPKSKQAPDTYLPLQKSSSPKTSPRAASPRSRPTLRAPSSPQQPPSTPSPTSTSSSRPSPRSPSSSLTSSPSSPRSAPSTPSWPPTRRPSPSRASPPPPPRTPPTRPTAPASSRRTL